MSFGHPGISALEFAGSSQNGSATTTLALRGRGTSSTQSQNRVFAITGDIAELEAPGTVLQELGSHQRRRGTFINHTPRNFEIRTSRSSKFSPVSTDTSSRLHASSFVGSEGSKTSSWSQPWHQSAPKDWNPEDIIERPANEPAELNSPEVDFTPIKESDTRAQTSTQDYIPSPTANQITVPRPVHVSSACNGPEGNPVSSCRSSQKSGKRRRRQTPYKIYTAKTSSDSFHPPLETFFANHHGEMSNSSLAKPPPNLDIEDVAEASTFRAIQEYFDSQASISSQPPERHVSSSHSNIPFPSSPEQPLRVSSTEPQATDPVNVSVVPPKTTPGIPHRNPRRLTTSFSSPIRDSDFTSAAQGQYSPYAKTHDDKDRPGSDHDSTRQAAQAGTSKLGRMAPPIPGHEALTATAVLNDLSYYLKNTGPSPEPQAQPPKRKKQGFKIFKVRGKKSLAARVGSVEGSPNRQRLRYTPACAREMTTSGGARHLRIVIPSEDLADDQTVTLPVSGRGQIRRSRHVSIIWTDEMLNPLASPALERAISDCNADAGPSSTHTTPLRSPKRYPVKPKPVPVDEHPLLTRDEQTRARKLRDLKRLKGQIGVMKSEDTMAGDLETALPPQNSEIGSSPKGAAGGADYGEGGQGDDITRKIQLLEERVVSVQKRNEQLAEALANMIGYEAEDGGLDFDAVLSAYRRFWRSADSN